jgi:hypothetical protein
MTLQTLKPTLQTDATIDRIDMAAQLKFARTRVNAKDDAISAREVIVDHGNIHRRNRSNPKPSSEPAIKASSIIKPLTSTSALTKASDNILPPMKVRKATMMTTMISMKPLEP